VKSDGSFLRVASEIAYGHHERWDGKGYPQGIGGDEIPLSARLMALADVYDALISKRIYKPAMSHTAAVEIIREGRGSHFDPEVLDTFLDLTDEFNAIAFRFSDNVSEGN
jgi:putative two-component system response regulator